MYVPCLALEQGTGVDIVFKILHSVFIICNFTLFTAFFYLVTGYPRNWIALVVMIVTVTYTTLVTKTR